MIRRLLVAICAFVVRVYFPRTEIVGAERIPKSGPLMFILNHPNGLLDPIFVLTKAERRVSFLAKEALFRTFLVNIFVRAFECLPVHRAHDGGDPRKNKQMIERAIELLAAGNAIAIFPEGVSHSDPGLRPFRTGAARIALAASSPDLGGRPVQIVPCGLVYSDKTTFRSRALVTFGEPVLCGSVELDENCAPPKGAVKELTNALQEALAEVTIHAPSMDVLRLAEKAEQIILTARCDDAALEGRAQPEASFSERRDMRKLLIHGYEHLIQTHPEKLRSVLAQLEAFEDVMAERRVAPEQQVLYPSTRVVWFLLQGAVVTLCLLPLALFGVVMNFLPYHFVAWLSVRYAKGEEDVIATVKVIFGALAYPVVWALWAVAAGAVWSWEAAAATFTLSPLLAYAALLFSEQASHAVTRGMVLSKVALRPRLRRAIVEERRRLRDAIVALEDLLPQPGVSRVEP